MTDKPPWRKDRELTAQLVGKLLSDQFPQLVPCEVEYFGEGWDFEAYLINGDTVFRFPKREDVVPCLLTELAVLKAIADSMPLPVPRYDYVGEASGGFPYIFAGYRLIPGTQLYCLSHDEVPAKGIGQQLGEFLSVLHTLPTDRIRAECPGLNTETDNLLTSLGEANKQYSAVKESIPPNLREQCETFLSGDEPPEIPQLPFCLIHNDFRMEHVLYHKETGAIGVIDWGDTCIANPLGDFVGIWMWGGDEMTRNALSAYSRNLTEEHLAAIRFMGLCVAFDEIEYGLAVSSADSIRLGITALEHAFTESP